MSGNIRWSEKEDLILKNHYGKIRNKEIAERFLPNRTIQAITHRGKKLKLKGLPPHRDKEFCCDELYFNEPNINNCYWAGFIAADGYIHNKQPILSLKLSESDKIILENFKIAIKSNHNILLEKGQPIYGFNNEKDYKYNRKNLNLIQIRSQKIIDDLKKHWNIINKKSLILQPPNITDPTHIAAYICGIFDGDGWITYTKDPKRPSLGFIMGFTGNLQILNWIKQQLEIYCPYLSWQDKILKSKNAQVYRLICKHKKGRTIHTFLKEFIDLEFRLPRKWNISYVKPEQNNNLS